MNKKQMDKILCEWCLDKVDLRFCAISGKKGIVSTNDILPCPKGQGISNRKARKLLNKRVEGEHEQKTRI